MTDPRPASDWHELTLGQFDFWEEFRSHPETVVSTVAHATRIEGNVDGAALAEAISLTTAEADVLALEFAQSGNAPPRQRVKPTLAPALWQLDLRGHADPEAEAQDRMQADIAQPLNLLTGPLAAQWLIRTGDQGWIWYCRGHHIFLDGYAMALIERRVAQHYAALTGGTGPGQPFARFTDFLREESDFRSGPRNATAGQFWTDYLSTGPDLPVLRKGSENYPGEPRSAELPLGDLSDALRDSASRLGLGWPDLLILLSGLWLWARPAGDGDRVEADRVIWLPFMNRLGSVSAGLPAMVVNILPFRITTRIDAPLEQALRDLSSDLRRIRRHGRYRIEQITADRGIVAGHRFFFSPLVNVMPFDPPVFPGCEAQREVLAAGPGDGFNATFAANGRGDGLVLYLDADPVLTSETLFRDHCDGLPGFLRRALTATSETRLADLLEPAPT
ncbi:condensation domain-containing protein [uncultured Paracoccus sp.]|uniref:condensation domain-containing protein n=1 Tax=uncultured Paracoccus sp. TaxID=189685 RepID=UPI002622298D|nr:condensation domain-containing protein [uncultured Paracoccus sp.]